MNTQDFALLIGGVITTAFIVLAVTAIGITAALFIISLFTKRK